jgi:hypothetical protein
MSLIEMKTLVPPQILETVRAMSKSKKGDTYVLQYGFLQDIADTPKSGKRRGSIAKSSNAFKDFKVTEGIQPDAQGRLAWVTVPPLSVEIDSLACYTGQSGLCLQLCTFPEGKKVVAGKGDTLFEGRIKLLSLLPQHNDQVQQGNEHGSGGMKFETSMRNGVGFKTELLQWPNAVRSDVVFDAKLSTDDFPTFSQLDSVAELNPCSGTMVGSHRVRDDHGVNVFTGAEPTYLQGTGGAVDPRPRAETSPGPQPAAPTRSERSQSQWNRSSEMTVTRDTQESEHLSPNKMVWQFEAVFPRGGHLGLDLTDSPPGSKSPLAVAAVRPGHAAARSQRIQAGDTLVQINSIPLHDFSYDECIDILKQASQGPLTMVCERTRFYQVEFLPY